MRREEFAAAAESLPAEYDTHCQCVFQVEDCLLPVGVARSRSSAEVDGLVTGLECDIEETNQSMHVIVPAENESRLLMSNSRGGMFPLPTR